MFRKNISFYIGSEAYNSQRPLIIAELGTSHNADPVKAREMISAAAEAGANCVKFQIVFADEILHPKTGEVALPGGKIRLYDRFKELEVPQDFYAELKKYAEYMGILFLCTPFGLKSASILHDLNPKIVKIASPELNFTSLLKEISAWHLPILLSTGVSLLADIEEALSILKNGNQLCLLHCITSYPAPENEYNLNILKNLSMIFGIPVGISDHTMDPELIPALSLSMGAAVIEKHFCLSRTDPGLDDPIALPPELFSRMVKTINWAAEAGPEKTLERFRRDWGEKTIEQVMGSGIKELAPSEKANYRLSNRSIHAMRDIKPGEIIKREDFAVLRTEKLLRPGLEPGFEFSIIGRTARNFIPAGEGIRFEDI